MMNKKAKYEYQFLRQFEAGIVLTGTEVKSLRNGEANLNDAYCILVRDELIIKSMFIAEYDHGNIHNHEPRRDRKLLLKRQEIAKISRKITEKGNSLIPYKLYFSERGFAKIELQLAVGKKAYDKRESIKERQQKRDLDRIKKSY